MGEYLAQVDGVVLVTQTGCRTGNRSSPLDGSVGSMNHFEIECVGEAMVAGEPRSGMFRVWEALQSEFEPSPAVIHLLKSDRAARWAKTSGCEPVEHGSFVTMLSSEQRRAG